MGIIRRIAKNSGWVMFSYIMQVFISMATLAYLARYLGSAGFGEYSLVFAYLSFFNIIVDLGISQILAREISRDRSKTEKFVGNAIIMKFVLGVFALICADLIISIVSQSANLKVLIYISSLSFLLSFGGVYSIIFQVNLRTEFSVIGDIIGSSMRFILFLYLISLKVSLFWFMTVNVACGIPAVLIAIFVSKRFVRPEFKLDFNIWKMLIKESWPIALTIVFIAFNARIDQLMLFRMKGPEALGQYAAIVKLTEIFGVIPGAFMVSVAPLLYRYFITSGEKMEKAYRLSFKYMAVLALPIATGMFVLSGPIIRLAYGQQFMGAVTAFKVLIWSEIFIFLGIVHINILISVGLQKLDFIFTATGAILNIILNLIFIPHYGIIGASLATVISYGIGVPMSCSLRKTRKYGLSMIYSLPRPIIASGLMGVITYYLHLHGVSMPINIALSAAVYLVFVIMIKGLNKEDFGYIREIAVTI